MEDNAISVLTISAQTCEANLTPLQNLVVQYAWMQASAQGITVVAAAGDSGSAACDTPGVTTATGGLAVNGYASTPYNIAVGGTDFYYGSTANPGNYWNATNNATTFESAKGYIPSRRGMTVSRRRTMSRRLHRSSMRAAADSVRPAVLLRMV